MGAELAPEGMLELIRKLIPWRRVFKLIQLTSRVQRMAGSFELFLFNISIDKSSGFAFSFKKLVRKYFASPDLDKFDCLFLLRKLRLISTTCVRNNGNAGDGRLS